MSASREVHLQGINTIGDSKMQGEVREVWRRELQIQTMWVSGFNQLRLVEVGEQGGETPFRDHVALGG